MNPYKPLLSSAPTHSILNAGFRYTNSVSTDIRETFARFRRKASSKRELRSGDAANLRTSTTSPVDETPRFGALAPLSRSAA